MTVEPDYLMYKHRRRGMDHDLYPYSNIFGRVPVTWPDGRTVAVAIVVSLEWFPITPTDTPFRAPGHMQTPYPDYRHYTSRDYGTRVGLYRLLDAFAEVGVKVSVATNAAIAERHPSVIRDIVAAGHEVVAHSTDMNGAIATGLSEPDERKLITSALDTLQYVAGVRPTGWLSVARSQSWNTPRLLAEAGVELMLDWVNDELPYMMTTPSGKIANLPLNHELSDRQIIIVQQHSAEDYVEQIEDAYQWVEHEAERTGGGRLLPLHLTPYVIGLPYRIGAFEGLIRRMATRKSAWFATVTEIAHRAVIPL